MDFPTSSQPQYMYIFIHTHKRTHTNVQREGGKKFILKKDVEVVSKEQEAESIFFFFEKIHFVKP